MSDHSADLAVSSLWANRKCFFMCCVVSIANFQYGLDAAAVGGLQAMPGFLKVYGFPSPKAAGGYAIDSTFQSLIASLPLLGCFISSALAGVIAHFVGRKTAIWIGCVLNGVACLAMILSEHKGGVYAGRLLLGLANGLFTNFSVIYTSEAAPAHLRGMVVALYAYWISAGSIIGAGIVKGTSSLLDKSSYQIPLGCLLIVPTILAVMLLFLPESPRYLLDRGRKEAARKSLEILRSNSVEPQYIELEWIEMNALIEGQHGSGKVAYLDMFRGTNLRRTLICWGAICCGSASGAWVFIAYSSYFFVVAGLSLAQAFDYTILQSCVGFIGIICGLFAIRRWIGRRTLFVLGGTFCGLSMLAVAVAATVAPNSAAQRGCLVAFACIFQFFSTGFVGAGTNIVATEVVSTRLRAYTVGSGTSIAQLLAWVTSFCSPYFINPQHLNWGAQYGYIWAGANAVVVLFAFCCIPEMKGRTLEEIDEMFMKRVTVWGFKSYQTSVRTEAMREARIAIDEAASVQREVKADSGMVMQNSTTSSRSDSSEDVRGQSGIDIEVARPVSESACKREGRTSDAQTSKLEGNNEAESEAKVTRGPSGLAQDVEAEKSNPSHSDRESRG